MSEVFEELRRTPELPDKTSDEVLEELSEDFAPLTIQPGDFTYQDIMDKFGLSRNQARHRISKLMAAGKIIELGYLGKSKYFRKVN